MRQSRRTPLALISGPIATVCLAGALLAGAPLALAAQGGGHADTSSRRATAGRRSAVAGASTHADTSEGASRADSIRISKLARRPPSVTHHAMVIGGRTLRYTATTGMLPIRNDTTGLAEGYIFFVAYTKDGTTDPANRPLTFAFNGGPGSSTVWLHLGAFGPKRVVLLPDGTAPAPPYSLTDNPNTLLDQTDIVFLDPVGTGYSRPARPPFGPRFWGLHQDVRTVGEFIRLYLTRYERWRSPKYLVGESYGTTRAAALSGYLADRGIALNGIVLISTILNFETAVDARGNDLGYVEFLPSYTAAAWYHKKLPADLEAESLAQVTQQAAQWAQTVYAPALMQGASMTPAERARTIAQLARYTGLSATYLDENEMRVSLGRFDEQLLRRQHLMIGRLDSRFTAYSRDAGAATTDFDPSYANITNVFTPLLNDYVRRDLHYTDDEVYWILGGGIGRWPYQNNNDWPRFPDVTPSLEHAMAWNPHMRVFVAMGYYDTATPYLAVEYTLAHLAISPAARANITTDHFGAGHMIYIDSASLAKLRGDLRAFYK